MANKFATGKHAIAICDRCGKKTAKKELREEVSDGNKTGILTCRRCWDSDHPQNEVGRYPVRDPQAIKNARPEQYDGNRSIQWGWAPVGLNNPLGLIDLENRLIIEMELGTVTVSVA
jgi:hypothetical protein